MILNNTQLDEVVGGTNLSASMITGIAKLFTSLFEIGENIGSAIYRIRNKNYC